MNSETDVCASTQEPTATAGVKSWRIGTLTYSLSGIIVLFLLLLAGDFIWSMRERSVVPVSQLLFKKFGASDFLNGIMITSLPCAIGMILCPIISYRSDRHRGRWGRRIPYLFLTTPIVVAGMLGMALSPLLAGLLAQWFPALKPATLVLLMFGLCWTLFEFGAIAGNVVFSALINDVVPHELLGRFYAFFRILSLAAGIIFNYCLFGWAETHYIWIFIGIGLIYGIGFTIMCLKIREGEYPPPVEKPQPTGSRFNAVHTYFKECYTSRYYWQLFAFFIISGLVFMPVNMFGLFYAQKLNVPLDHYGKYIAYSYVISFILSYPLGMLADKFHPLRCGIVMMALYMITCAVSGMVICNETTYAAAMIVHTVVSGSYFTVTASLPMRLFPQSRFAQFGSACGIVGSITAMIITPAVGSFLDLTGHEYRYTYFLAALFASITMIIVLVYYQNFKARGGPHHYVAPE